jgi:hypothetical protein
VLQAAERLIEGVMGRGAEAIPVSRVERSGIERGVWRGAGHGPY